MTLELHKLTGQVERMGELLANELDDLDDKSDIAQEMMNAWGGEGAWQQRHVGVRCLTCKAIRCASYACLRRRRNHTAEPIRKTDKAIMPQAVTVGTAAEFPQGLNDSVGAG